METNNKHNLDSPPGSQGINEHQIQNHIHEKDSFSSNSSPESRRIGVVDTVKNDESGPDLSPKAILNYLKTRVTSLIIPKSNLENFGEKMNLYRDLKIVSRRQWLFIWIAIAAWTWDAFDFFIVTLNISMIADEYNVSIQAVTWCVTIAVMMRTVGSIGWGYVGDKYSRKWSMVFNLAVNLVIEIGTGFAPNKTIFMACRALYGMSTGGIFGNATATALDDCPTSAKGVVSGLLQWGFPLGYLLSVIFTRALANTTKQTWRSMFWFAAGIQFLIMVGRLLLPETKAFLERKKVLQEEIEVKKTLGIEDVKTPILKTIGHSVKIYWLLMLYMFLAFAGFNFLSHGSQDIFPTYLSQQLLFSEDRSTVANCVGNLGAMLGGAMFGHFSNIFGRRLCMLVLFVCGGSMVYPWIYVKGTGQLAPIFFFQFFVQGAWGVIPIYMSELSPPNNRAFVVGLSYQLGNLAASASGTIETILSENFPIMVDGKPMTNYGKIIAIFTGAVFVFLIFVIFLGPENINSDLNADNKEHLHMEDIDLSKADLHPTSSHVDLDGRDINDKDQRVNEIIA